MKIKGVFSALVLLLAAVVAAPTYASSVDTMGTDVLYSNSKRNKNLDAGEYDFAAFHSRYGSSFKDAWKFTVAEDTTASISVYDLETSFGRPSFNVARARANANAKKIRATSRWAISTSKIFDTKNLTFSLFDSKGNLIGQAGENQTLNNLNLVSGMWYTLQVSGKVNGFFGSSYHGVLDINPTPVPLGDTAPLLGSALALLALRYRRTA